MYEHGNPSRMHRNCIQLRGKPILDRKGGSTGYWKVNTIMESMVHNRGSDIRFGKGEFSLIESTADHEDHTCGSVATIKPDRTHVQSVSSTINATTIFLFCWLFFAMFSFGINGGFRITNRVGYGTEFIPVGYTRDITHETVLPILSAVTGINNMDECFDDCVPRIMATGSFSDVWSLGDVCARFTRISEGSEFINRIKDALGILISNHVISYVRVYGDVIDSSGRRLGLLIFMDHLEPLGAYFDDELSIFSTISRLSDVGFHNDFKIDNIMKSGSMVHAIDFDLFSPTKLVVALSGTSFIELDIAPFANTLPDPTVFWKKFRTFYDYTCLSLSIGGNHPLYISVLKRLVTLFNDLPLVEMNEYLGDAKVRDIPVEVLVRCPDGVDGVSVNFFDLQGNAFAHGLKDWMSYPGLYRSTGVYWPDR